MKFLVVFIIKGTCDDHGGIACDYSGFTAVTEDDFQHSPLNINYQNFISNEEKHCPQQKDEIQITQNMQREKFRFSEIPSFFTYCSTER